MCQCDYFHFCLEEDEDGVRNWSCAIKTHTYLLLIPSLRLQYRLFRYNFCMYKIAAYRKLEEWSAKLSILVYQMIPKERKAGFNHMNRQKKIVQSHLI